MVLVAKGAACPPDSARTRRGTAMSWFRFWAASAAAAAAQHPECGASADACRATPACYLPAFERQMAGFASGDEAQAAAAAAPGTVDAVLDFSAWQQGQGQRAVDGGPSGSSPHAYTYTLRMNHSEVPPTRIRLNQARGLGWLGWAGLPGGG